MRETFWVYMTASSAEEARAIASAVVAERLAACVNLLGEIESVYWWEGSVQSGSEVALVAKTTAGRLQALTARVRELHSYDCPCVVALPITSGHEPFLEWIRRETAPPSP